MPGGEDEVPSDQRMDVEGAGGLVRVDDGVLVDLRCSVLVFEEDSVLLCRRTDEADVWVLPGGTPRSGEAMAATARREVVEETGIQITAERVAFVLETSSWDRAHHRIEIVFLGEIADRHASPAQREAALDPVFLPLTDLDTVGLRPPLGGYIRGFARSRQFTAPYLGNLWRPGTDQAATVEGA